jgi:hypothetical protein
VCVCVCVYIYIRQFMVQPQHTAIRCIFVPSSIWIPLPLRLPLLLPLHRTNIIFVWMILATTFPHENHLRHHVLAATESSCLLDCANDAICVHHFNTGEKWKISGHLVDSCSCPWNYGGVACDIPRPNCRQDADCSGSFNPCVDGQCQNACVAAAQWLHSSFVEYACLKAMTDYCPNGEYCTHGGKCISGFQGAAAAAAAKYQNSSQLCQCPKEFTGRHCERVILPSTVPLPAPMYASSSFLWKQRAFTIGLSISIAILIICLAAYLWVKNPTFYSFCITYRRKRRQSFSSVDNDNVDDCNINPHNEPIQNSSMNADHQILNSSSASGTIRRVSPRSSHNSSPTNEEEVRTIV